MPISDLPLFATLRERMHWHQERQRVLSENVANADTPGFQPRDLSAFRPPRAGARGDGQGSLALVRSDPLHLGPGGGQGGASRFEAERRGRFEVRPAGNAVVLEDEMLKVAQNQMDHQSVTTLYARSLALVRTALGRRG